jgi:cytochrome d ubiquinol oxidase subunit II
VPYLRSALRSPLVLGLVLGTVGLAGMYAAATSRDRHYVAFGAAGLVFALVGVVAGLMYPTVDRAGGPTADSAVVSTLPLNLMPIGAALLLPLVSRYFGALCSAFSGPVETEESS